MKKKRNFLIQVACAGSLLVPMVLWAAEGTSSPQTTTQSTTLSPAQIKQEMFALTQDRDAALQEWQGRYQRATTEQRPALEAEGTSITEQYEREYLALEINYDRATGNTEGMTRAQNALALLNSKDAPARVASQAIAHTKPMQSRVAVAKRAHSKSRTSEIEKK